MLIWFFSPNGQPKGHGSRIYNYSIEMVRRGHQVTIFTKSFIHRSKEEYLDDKEKVRIEIVDGIRVVWIRTQHYSGNDWKRGISELQFAWRALKIAIKMDESPDIIIGDSVPPFNGLAASIAADRKKSQFVYQIRDVWPIALVHDGSLSKNSPIYWIFRIIEKYLYRKSAGICATMPFLHQHVLDSGGDPSKITCIPNGVNLDMYPKKLSEYDGGAKKKPLVAMYVGSISFAHDVITIVKAANILKSSGENKYKFIIVGDGVKKKECEKEAAEKSLANIDFIETIPKSEVPEIQKQADIFIACVLDSKAYSFGINLNKIYDYFASGRPVIFSGKAPNDHVSISGAGFSIPPENPQYMADSLERYFEMTIDERKEMGVAAREYAEKEFDTRVLAGRFEKILLDIANKRKPEFY